MKFSGRGDFPRNKKFADETNVKAEDANALAVQPVCSSTQASSLAGTIQALTSVVNWDMKIAGREIEL